MLHNGLRLANTFICSNESHKTKHLRACGWAPPRGLRPICCEMDGQKSNCKSHTSPLWIDSMCVSPKRVFHLSTARWTFTTPDRGAEMGGNSKSRFFEEEVLNGVRSGGPEVHCWLPKPSYQFDLRLQKH